MNLSGQNIGETLFKIGADGARPHIQAGIVKRMRAVVRAIETQFPNNPMARSLAIQLEAEIENIEAMT